MINPLLHVNPTALDREAHKALRLRMPVTDWGVAKRLNALFVAAVEFGDVAREYPIVFVRADKDDQGRDLIAPIAVLGTRAEENLYLAADGSWRAAYIPATLRCFPFCIGRMPDDNFAMCVDLAWDGAKGDDGVALFQPGGEPSELLVNMQKHLEALETEVQRTRLVGQRLLELDLLREMRFDATLPDGTQHTIDGFLTIDEAKARDLPDAVVGQLHRDGILSIIHAHWLSLGNMRRLMDWHVERNAPRA